MPYNKEKHDFGILRTSGIKVGLMTQRGKDNVFNPESYVVDDEPYLVEQITTSGAGYSSLNPIKEIALIEDDFSGGAGLEFQDGSRVHMYHESFGMDCRFKGSMLPGQTVTAVNTNAYVAVPTIVSAGFETWSDANTPTGWVYAESYVGNTVTREDTIKEEGSYSAKLFVKQTGTYYSTLTQTISTNVAGCRNCLWTVTARVKDSATAMESTITLSDGTNSVTSAVSAASTDWQTLTASMIIVEGATALAIQCKSLNTSAASDYETYWDNVTQAIDTSYSAVKNFCTFNDKIYYSTGGSLMSSASATVPVWTSAYAITSVCPFGSYLFVGRGSTQTYYYFDTSETATASTLADPYAQQFAVVNLTLWKSILPNELKSNTDGLNTGGAWSGATLVDSTFNNITSLLSYDGALNIFKEDRPYYLDSTGAVKIWTDATIPLTSSTGGSLSFNWNGNTYAVWGNNLLENADGAFQWLSPIEYFSNASNFCGNIVGITGDNSYLYVMVDDSTSVHILAGREETNDNGTQWIWHPFSYITLGTGSSLYCSNVTDERIWIGGTNYVGYVDNDITTTGLPGKTFTTSGYFTTPWYHLDFIGDQKAFIKLTLNMESTTANLFFTVYYKKWNDSAWTSIGDFKTSPSTTKYIPVDSGANKPVSTHIKFKIVATSNAATTLFKLHSLDLRAVLYPTRRKIHKIVCRAGDMVLDKQGSYLDTPTSDIDATIEEAMNKTYPFTFYDIWGNTKTGKLLPSTPFKKPAPRENYRGFDTLYYLNIEEITIS